MYLLNISKMKKREDEIVQMKCKINRLRVYAYYLAVLNVTKVFKRKELKRNKLRIYAYYMSVLNWTKLYAIRKKGNKLRTWTYYLYLTNIQQFVEQKKSEPISKPNKLRVWSYYLYLLNISKMHKDQSKSK